MHALVGGYRGLAGRAAFLKPHATWITHTAHMPSAAAACLQTALKEKVASMEFMGRVVQVSCPQLRCKAVAFMWN